MTQAYNLAILANAVDTSGRLNVGTNATGTLPVANGGTGTSTPSLVAGSGISITGSFPNQTIATTSSGTPGINTVVFASSGSWTAPTGVTKIFAYCVGGGGGGGGHGQTDLIVTGGGGGLAYGQLTVVAGTTYTITVGAGGAGNNSTTASSGTSSSIGALMSATGGGGSTNAGNAGAQGSGSGGTLYNGSIQGGYPDPAYIGLGLFYGRRVRTNGSGLAAVAWSTSSAFLPGAPGEAENNSTTNNCAGGVGGAVIIQYIG